MRKAPADHTFRTVLLGFGNIAAGYTQDARMKRWIPYATHAQVLRDHPVFSWAAVVDPSPTAREEALRVWDIEEVVGAVEELADPASFEIAVLATPPDIRIGLLDRLPGLKAIVVEKPLATDVDSARKFLEACIERDIQVQVNLPRRADTVMRDWVESLSERLGKTQAVFANYGNGLVNNGSHLIDWIRMFLGEIKWVRAIPEGPNIVEGPIPGDISFPFVLGLVSGICVMVQPLGFPNYREIGLDIWGERGRLSFWHEGLTAAYAPRADHRFLETHYEIASDHSEFCITGQGHAIYNLYDNLADTLSSNSSLWSPGSEALKVMVVLESIKRSHASNGSREEV